MCFKIFIGSAVSFRCREVSVLNQFVDFFSNTSPCVAMWMYRMKQKTLNIVSYNWNRIRATFNDSIDLNVVLTNNVSLIRKYDGDEIT